ncbi:anti-sigma factor RsiW [Kitasatospora sp. MAP12-15]|uniref:anti-sigma factor family protein n=1 Tax=unclassified Kitasatospora TaxID=2633591 RepID=UPI002475D3C4|nr:zf-HC2 domain-containing protein [Kitasatospora sp. MAP12-44]MDH6112659.1 anti-sigma factor RsiW [Kitasatospora sp. MAP12-44]
MLRPITVRQVEPPAPAEEHHLGERLTAYLDGELGHDARERVQSHLATCAQCLSEADEARAVKQLLSATEPAGPSALLMSRLLAVAAPPDGEVGPPGDGPRGGLTLPTATLGGSRLTGGSFGRGAGSSFGAGALGADAPVPGADPRAGRGPDVRLWTGRRGPARSVLAPSRPPAAVPVSRPPAPRGRRFVFAAAGAFSVAAVALGGFGSLGLAAVAGDSPVDDPHGSAVVPRVPGGEPDVPFNAQVPADFPARSQIAPLFGLATPSPSSPLVNPVVNPVVNSHRLLR